MFDKIAHDYLFCWAQKQVLMSQQLYQSLSIVVQIVLPGVLLQLELLPKLVLGLAIAYKADQGLQRSLDMLEERPLEGVVESLWELQTQLRHVVLAQVAHFVRVPKGDHLI